MLPDADGFTVLERLRTEPKTMHLPVIIVTAKTDMAVKLRAFHLLVNDFLTKPFQNDELLARVRAHMHHSHASLLSPLTRLPGGTQIERAIEQRVTQAQPWACIYVDLDHFKALNDAYGFWRGNEMIRLLRDAIVSAVRENGNIEDFIGHIGGEDFIVLSTPERIHSLCQAIIQRFAQQCQHFYRPEDIARGGFFATARDGSQQWFTLVTVSIAVLTSATLIGHVSLAELSLKAAEIKVRSKSAAGNCYVIDGDPTIYRVASSG
jgi:diguanylate cyclase (GGDEF)-like protein